LNVNGSTSLRIAAHVQPVLPRKLRQLRRTIRVREIAPLPRIRRKKFRAQRQRVEDRQQIERGHRQPMPKKTPPDQRPLRQPAHRFRGHGRAIGN
jgi:hypothetical protein